MGPFNASGLKEQCDKATQILQEFLQKGKIPDSVIENAAGVAIFSAFRAGMYFAGTAGTGVVLARLPDGSWSPPSAFGVRSTGIGIVYGVDHFDCVCVLNTPEAVDAYRKAGRKVTGGITLAAGSIGTTNNKQEGKSVLTYTKSDGIFGGMTVDSTSVRELSEVNEAFYGDSVTAAQILEGRVSEQVGDERWPVGAKRLLMVLKAVDQRTGRA